MAGTKHYIAVRCDLCGCGEHVQQYRLVNSSIVNCSNCGFHFISPRVSPDILQATLQQWAQMDVLDAERIRIAFEPATLDLYRRYAGWIARYASGSQRTLLDVGCSTGALLQVFRDQGWGVQGIELGQASSQYARDQLGLTVFEGSLHDFDCAPAALDVIAFTEVIEHLESPTAALKKMHAWLKPDGLILITTPNFNSLYRRRYGAKWWVINCEEEHIMFFSPDSLKALLHSCGYTVVFEHIRGMDFIGMFNQMRNRDDTTTSPDETAGYYAARSGKERVKRALATAGALHAARWAMRGLDFLFSKKWSPFYAWGEQLIVIARKKTE